MIHIKIVKVLINFIFHKVLKGCDIMVIKHTRPHYETEELEEKAINETMHRICRKLVVARNKGKEVS